MPAFYEKAGSLISPGDFFDRLPYIRVPRPIKVVRKVNFNLPSKLQNKLSGELAEVFEVGKHHPSPNFDFEPPGEPGIVNMKMAKAIFLTWGSEVEADERSGNLHKKDWLIAPVFPLLRMNQEIPDSGSGENISLADAIRTFRSPKFFPLQAFPDGDGIEYYVDFRKICPLAANHFSGVPRHWRLARAALNDFYHQLMWFFTRKKIFFGPVACQECGKPVDLSVTFEGQPINPPTDV